MVGRKPACAQGATRAILRPTGVGDAMYQVLFHQRLQSGRLVWLAPLVLAACFAPTDLPPRQADMQGASPELLPLSSILAQVEDGPNTARLTDSPDGRVAALQARAAQLRGAVIAPDQRERMLLSDQSLR